MLWLCWDKLSWPSSVSSFLSLGLLYHVLFFPRNPGTATIEGALEEAIVKAGGISPVNAGTFHKVGWGRCARTDRGVHAAGQIITLKV